MTVATELATAAYFQGRWQMVRLIDDRAAGVFGEFWGEAVFEALAVPPASDAAVAPPAILDADASAPPAPAAAPQGQGQAGAPPGRRAAAPGRAEDFGQATGDRAGAAASRGQALSAGGAGPAARDAAASERRAPAPAGSAPRGSRGAAEPETGARPEAAAAPEGGGNLVCRESGVLRFGGRDFAAGRVTFWRFGPAGAIHVAHDDGRPFHSFHPAEPQALHLCGEDRYEVDYSFTPDVWTSHWRVSGPRKDYTMTTRYCRITGG